MNNQESTPTTPKKMIAICSAIGGTGRTTVTVNLASIFAKRGLDVSVMDADRQFGDISLAMDLDPVYTMKDFAMAGKGADVTNYCTIHKNGVQVLPAPERPEYAELISTELLEFMWSSLHEVSDVLLVETSSGLYDQSLQLMEQADHILLVTTGGMAALKNTRLMIETIEALDLKNKVSVIMNQSPAPSVIKPSEIANLLATDSIYELPYDIKRIPLSFDNGTPIVDSIPTCEFSKKIMTIADHLVSNNRLEKQSGNTVLQRLKGLRGKKHELISKASIKEPEGEHT